MAVLVRVESGGALTLPAEAREALRLEEGDYLEAEVADGAVKLTPVPAVDREKAWDELIAIVEEDKWVGPEPRPVPEEEERWIFERLADARE